MFFAEKAENERETLGLPADGENAPAMLDTQMEPPALLAALAGAYALVTATLRSWGRLPPPAG